MAPRRSLNLVDTGRGIARRLLPLLTPLTPLVVIAALGGCDGELVVDELPSVYDDPTLGAQIAAHDDIDGVAPRLSGFVHGEPVYYWTLGERPETSMALYQLCRMDDGRCEPIGHPPIVDALPGDEGYSPFGRVHEVEVTDAWRSRTVESLEALLRMVDEGALEPPRPTSAYRHCAIAHEDAALEVGLDQTLGPETLLHHRGRSVRCFDFSSAHGERPLLPGGEMFVRHVYLLRRESETLPIAEAMREEDLTGDGRTTASNNIFGVGLDDGDYTPLWRMVPVTVAGDYNSIDTYMDATRADYTAATDMFDIAPDYTITPLPDRILDHELTEILVDCPLQSAEGGL